MKNMTILIAEDDRVSCEYLYEILREQAATILIANDGIEAVSACEEHPEIDLVLMDIKMPGLSGIEATRSIKALRPGLPVIAQTAYAFDGERVSILRSGFDGYLAKPIRREELLTLIRKFSRQDRRAPAQER
ncbi:MAG: response regulator [Candidatus Marinimicrobia bacterium]|nr:response regulator [Candidatus Neomarinimicrobiota bacterium]